MLVEAGIVSAPDILRLTVSGQRNEPSLASSAFQPTCHFISVDARQADVEKNDFGIECCGALERFRTAVYRLCHVSGEIQDHCQRVCRIDVVIHDEDTSLYGRLLRFLFRLLGWMGNG